MKKLLSKQDEKLVEAAVTTAELQTSGEIVPVLVETSGDYSFVAHRLGLAGVVLTSIAAWLLPHNENLFWEFSFVFSLQGAGWLLGYLLGSRPFVIRLLAGRAHLAAEVHESALASFLHNNLHSTRDRTGVLIFISQLEHKVEILADHGIHAKVGADYWRAETKEIARGLREGKPGPTLARVIQEIGTRLGEHFPRKPDDTDELPNGVRSR